MNKIKKILYILVLFLIVPISTNAAILYFDPAEGEYGPGDSFTSNIKIDIDNECINTIEANISFPNSHLNILDFATGESFLSIWIDKPGKADMPDINKKGVIHFSGGIPGGYCGKIPGDPGESNIVGKIIFSIPGMIISDVEPDTLDVVFLSDSRVLLNDGLGSEDKLTTRNAGYKYLTSPTKSGEEWREDLKKDKIAPNPFVVELRSDPGIYDGKYYIIFSTVDKQTGVDRFEVLEITPEELAGIAPELAWYDKLYNYYFGDEPTPSTWKTAKMPYLLIDQSLHSIIKVRAIDKAGNERMVEYIPPESMQKATERYSHKTIVITALTVLGVITIIIILMILIIIKKIINNLRRPKDYEDN